MPYFARLACAVAVFAAAACNRYEYRPPDCPAGPPPRDSVRRVPGAPGRIAGTVVDMDTRAPLRSAAVAVEPAAGPSPTRWARSR